MRCRGWRLSVITPTPLDKSVQQIHLARVIYQSIPSKMCLSFAYSWRQQICTRIAIPSPCCREWSMRHGHANRHVSSEGAPVNHLLPVKCLFVYACCQVSSAASGKQGCSMCGIMVAVKCVLFCFKHLKNEISS